MYLYPKILLVEDNAVQASTLSRMLVSMGYDPPGVCSDYFEAVTMLATGSYHIAVIDIDLNGEKSGIDVARFINNQARMPFLFLTFSSSFEALDSIKEVNPSAFLVKPVRQSDLFAAIEIAFQNENLRASATLKASTPSDKATNKSYLFIKDNNIYHKVDVDEILYVSSNHVYVTVHTQYKTYLVRASLAEYADLLDPAKFLRVHRKYIVNINKVGQINGNKIMIKDEEIQIAKSCQKELVKRIATTSCILSARFSSNLARH